MKIAIIGAYPPEQCGIATFTRDFFGAISLSGAEEHGVVAVSDGSEHVFPNEVVFVVDRSDANSYIEVANFLNSCYDACIIQHEFGIFGGTQGSFISHMLEHLRIPIVTNLHTVSPIPGDEEFRIVRQLAHYSSKITVMTNRAVQFLSNAYGIGTAKVESIPHGTPLFDYNQDFAKAALGLSGQKVMLSFGLLGPEKGFETAIESLIHIQDDDFTYIILGQTHPEVLRREGERYRESLIEKAITLGVAEKVQFVDVFASEELLVQYLTACDLFVTPYPDQDQICSGTLTFALGAGAAVISTPYLYALDLLAEDKGLFFGFGDSEGLAGIIRKLLQDPKSLAGYRARARDYGSELTWPKIGQAHRSLLESLDREPLLSITI